MITDRKYQWDKINLKMEAKIALRTGSDLVVKQIVPYMKHIYIIIILAVIY